MVDPNALRARVHRLALPAERITGIAMLIEADLKYVQGGN
jgi:hypothetical protein